MMMGGFGMFGWFFGLIFMLLFLGIFVLGAVWFVRQLTGNGPSRSDTGTVYPASGRTCPTCGRPMQPNWTVCPYDGTPLT